MNAANAENIDDAGGKPLTPRERLECLIMSQLNEEKAEVCRDDQPALKAFFLKNAEVFRHVAGK